MQSVKEFPYGEMSANNPMHEKMLLLKLRSGLGTRFSIGYYDAVNQVFRACHSPFRSTKSHWYDERVIAEHGE